jgi:D-arabinose 1-dehydrogenase-like Zn-dependent alcohol dehydrogenase
LRVLGSRYASCREIADGAAQVAAGKVRPVIGSKVGLDGIASVHSELRRGELLGRGALIFRSVGRIQRKD